MLMETKQERDEPIRSYMARLKGLANNCSLMMKCPGDTCTETMSYMDSTILLDLVKGLHNELTKGEILSKVEQMDLDTTITFVEARETGKRDLAQLGSGGLASQVHQVKVRGKCWRCRQEGHHGNDKPDVRKKMCKAFSTKCTKCEEVGHFAKFCRPPRPAGGKPKGEHVESQNMGVMHHTITTINTYLCQNKMSTKTVSKQKCKDSKL